MTIAPASANGTTIVVSVLLQSNQKVEINILQGTIQRTIGLGYFHWVITKQVCIVRLQWSNYVILGLMLNARQDFMQTVNGDSGLILQKGVAVRP